MKRTPCSFDIAGQQQGLDPVTATGRAALDAVMTQQAQIIAYVDDYKFLMIATLAVIPLLLAFRKPPSGCSTDHALALE